MKFYFFAAACFVWVFAFSSRGFAETYNPTANNIYALIGGSTDMSQEALIDLCDQFELAPPSIASEEAKEVAARIKFSFASKDMRVLYDILLAVLKRKSVDLEDEFSGLVQLERFYEFACSFSGPEEMATVKWRALLARYNKYSRELPSELMFRFDRLIPEPFNSLIDAEDEECGARLSCWGN